MNRQSPVVVITGASSDIGRAIDREFARHGAAVGLLAREPAELDVVQSEAEVLGAPTVAVAADLSEPDQVEAAIERIERELGPIDIWIDAVRTDGGSSLAGHGPTEIRHGAEITYVGAFREPAPDSASTARDHKLAMAVLVALGVAALLTVGLNLRR